MDFDDPLRGYRAPKHPSPETDISSAPSSPETYRDRRQEVDAILDAYTPVRDTDDTVLVFQAFLKHLCKQGQAVLMQEIVLLQQDPAQLRMLRNFLVDAILKPLKLAGGINPKSVASSPMPEAVQSIKSMVNAIQPSTRNEQGTIKEQCLLRDGNKCVITGTFEKKYWQKLQKQDREGLEKGSTQCAHILPFSLRKFNEKSSQETETKATIWWGLYRYFPYIEDKIEAGTINQLENVVTLLSMYHGDFGEYSLALQPTSEKNRYRTHCYTESVSSAVERGCPAEITLKQSDSHFPLPDPDFFRVHFEISQILQVCGIGEKLNIAMWENELDTSCIFPDGSTDLGGILMRKMLMHI